MTLKELKATVDAMYSDETTEYNICIPNNQSSMGSLSVTDIRSIGFGIDWDKGKVFIWPKVDMVNKS